VDDEDALLSSSESVRKESDYVPEVAVFGDKGFQRAKELPGKRATGNDEQKDDDRSGSLGCLLGQQDETEESEAMPSQAESTQVNKGVIKEDEDAALSSSESVREES
jgi:hypothetical protein